VGMHEGELATRSLCRFDFPWAVSIIARGRVSRSRLSYPVLPVIYIPLFHEDG
jgi:hypothetical protein